MVTAAMAAMDIMVMGITIIHTIIVAIDIRQPIIVSESIAPIHATDVTNTGDVMDAGIVITAAIAIIVATAIIAVRDGGLKEPYI